MKKSLLAVFLVVFLLGSLPVFAAEPIKIGVIVDLSASTALWGQSQARGVEMAVEKYNEAGGLLGRPIELKVYDFKLDVQEGINAYQRLANQDKVSVVIGAPVSNLNLALAPIADQLKVPIVGEASDARTTSKTPTEPWPYMFASQLTCVDYGEAAASYAIYELGAANLAVINNKGNAWADEIAEAFVKYAEAHGAKIVAREAFNWGDTDFRSQLSNIQRRNPDAILVPEYLQEASQITRQAREMGIDVVILGPNSFTPPMVELIGDAANNVYFVNNVAFDLPAVKEFTEAYVEKYGTDLTVNAFFGHDNTVIALEAIRRANSADPKAIRDELEKTENVQGLIFNYTIDPVTHRTDGFIPTVIKIEDGEYITVGLYEPVRQ